MSRQILFSLVTRKQVFNDLPVTARVRDEYKKLNLIRQQTFEMQTLFFHIAVV